MFLWLNIKSYQDLKHVMEQLVLKKTFGQTRYPLTTNLEIVIWRADYTNLVIDTNTKQKNALIGLTDL